jgi:hypothetical protein
MLGSEVSLAQLQFVSQALLNIYLLGDNLLLVVAYTKSHDLYW